MKEVTKKDLPEISGGEYQVDGPCIPDPFRLDVPDPGFPVEPTVPYPLEDRSNNV